jgi:hypothetical protein
VVPIEQLKKHLEFSSLSLFAHAIVAEALTEKDTA